MNVSPFSYTSKRFSALLHEKCGRGLQQAGALYSCFMKKGFLREDLLPFKNARQLFREMISHFDRCVLQHEVIGEEAEALRFTLETHDKHCIESVLMKMKHGYTLCVSCQIGCRMGCMFCCTGRGGFVRNLSSSEIVQQLFVARHILKKDVKNIVFMGMGEAFDTRENVFQAVDVFSDPLGFNVGMKHITLSTSGDIEGILSMAEHERPMPNLAVSLNAVTDEKRAFLMPYRKKDPLHLLKEALTFYCTKRRKEVLVSYVLLKGINDSREDMERLILFLKNIPSKVNLIPFNAYPGAAFEESEARVVETWLHSLREQKVRVLLRGRKGSSINAACGQLQKRNIHFF